MGGYFFLATPCIYIYKYSRERGYQIPAPRLPLAQIQAAKYGVPLSVRWHVIDAHKELKPLMMLSAQMFPVPTLPLHDLL